MTLRAETQSIDRLGTTRSPRGSLGLDLALWRATNLVLGAHQEGARYRELYKGDRGRYRRWGG